VSCSPPPAIITGGRGFWTGFGSRTENDIRWNILFGQRAYLVEKRHGCLARRAIGVVDGRNPQKLALRERPLEFSRRHELAAENTVRSQTGKSREQIGLAARLRRKTRATPFDPARNPIACRRASNDPDADAPRRFRMRQVERAVVHEPEADVEVTSAATEFELRLADMADFDHQSLGSWSNNVARGRGSCDRHNLSGTPCSTR
jgi:hypothetical protein